MGLNSSSIGTLGIIGNEEIQDTNITTPDPVLLHQTLTDYLVRDYTSCLGGIKPWLVPT